MFKVIEKPNDFIKNSKVVGNNENLNKSQAERLEFWNKFNEVIEKRGKPFNLRKPTTDHWYSVAIGTSEAHIDITLVNKDNKIGVGLWIPNNKEMYDLLFENKENIENELSCSLNWDRKQDNQKASSVILDIPGLNFDDHSNYEELMQQIIDNVVKMKKVFKKYIK